MARKYPVPKVNLRFGEPARYRITIQGNLESDWFCLLHDYQVDIQALHGPDYATVLSLLVQDQSELAGFLNAVYNLRVPLLEVRFVKDGEEEE